MAVFLHHKIWASTQISPPKHLYYIEPKACRMIWCFAGNTTYLETAAYSFILGFRGIRGHWHDGKSEGYAAVTSMGG